VAFEQENSPSPTVAPFRDLAASRSLSVPAQQFPDLDGSEEVAL
jgi:hypothetical protein